MRRGDGIALKQLVTSLIPVVALLTLPIPATANNIDGAWSPVRPWPLIAIHAALMPDGRVLSYRNRDIYDVWDPSAGLDGGHLTLPNNEGGTLFCSSLLMLPEGGGVFIAGGGATVDTPDRKTNVFDYENNTLARYGDMNRPRWYSTSTTLLNGEIYIQGGSGGTDHPEVRDANGVFRLLDGADTDDLEWGYPRNFVAPDGRVFGFDSNGFMYYVSPGGAGAISMSGQFTGPKGRQASSAMFQPGRILQFGGSVKTAKIIDITGGSPVVSTTQSLSTNRRWVNATILPDGRVLATGGSEEGNKLVGVNNRAEIWDPASRTWSLGAEGELARLYHSLAILLPDASVLVAGGGSPGPLANNNAEIYYPPYLFDAGGAWAPRPAVASAPTYIDIGETFTVDLADGSNISRFVMIKTGAVTHSFNMEQRFVELTFQQSGPQLIVQAPTRGTDAPPGYYLLFAIDSAGTPSIGRIARVGIADSTSADVVPSLADPGNQSGVVGTPTELQLEATDPNGDPLTFAASGLPPGLGVDGDSGLISGTPTALGNFNVVLVATDGVNSASVSIVWTIAQAPGSFTLHAPPTPAPVLAGTEVSLEASVTGGTDVQYKWDFDDGTPETPYSSSPVMNHVFAQPGIYYVTVTAIDATGLPQVTTVVVTVHLPLTANRPAVSGNLMLEDRVSAGDRLWVVNPDNDSVSVFDTASNDRIAEINVGRAPRTLAVAPTGEIWVANHRDASITVIDAAGLAVARTISLPAGSQPYGIVASPSGDAVYVVLEALGRLLRLDPASGDTVASLNVGPNPRHVSVASGGDRVYVSRFVTPPLPGESTAAVQTEAGGNPVGGEVVVVDGSSMVVQQTIVLRHSDEPDFEIQGRGIPNYLGAVAISPDGHSAWVPSKQDNVRRGTLRDGQGLTFQNTVRAISSRLDLGAGAEDYPARIDHDDASVASAIAYDRLGVYMFVALETSREIAVVDAHGDWEMFRFNVGRAPQGLAVSGDGQTLYVHNFMDRSISVFELSELLDEGIANVPLVATRPTIGSEKLAAQVLQGKKLFYDARDARLARDRYISCASCHNDGGDDGRVWDLTGFGEGLRNTVSLRGRGGGQGFLHWSNNFDEVQDFEGQIRALAGGTGLMTNAQLNTGTRSQPLGDAKSGVSGDLDALAAYVASLDAFPPSPHRNAGGSLTSAGEAGRQVFIAKNCAGCHGGTAFTNSGNNNPQDIGTLRPESGQRLGGALTGIDVPTLRDVWATAPYLHLGSAATLDEAIVAHDGITLTAAELADLVAYVQQIGSQESTAPGEDPPDPPPPPPPPSGTGLTGKYYKNKTLSGTAALTRIEVVNFGWGTKSPGPGIGKDNFSVRWTGTLKAPTTGNYKFRTVTNDGVRLWVDGAQVINSWVNRSKNATKTSAAIPLTAGQQYVITMEFYDNTGGAVARLKWLKPGTTTYATVPKANLYSN